MSMSGKILMMALKVAFAGLVLLAIIAALPIVIVMIAVAAIIYSAFLI